MCGSEDFEIAVIPIHSMQRILYIDILKLFTIFLVLWGHAIMHFQPDYEKSYIFQIIYAFHMPLFMMLSGYFAVSSMELGARDFFTKKFRQLLLPCISWAVVCWLIITSGLIEGKFHLEIKGLFSGWLGIVDNLWFLKSCFICYTLTWFCYRCGRYKVVAMAVLWVLCTMQGHFHLDRMFPSFLLGLYLRNNDWFINKLSHYRNLLYVFLLSAFLFFFTLHSKIYIFRLVLGISGALACFILFRSTFNRLLPTPLFEKLARMGGATCGIYAIDSNILVVFLPMYISFRDFPIYTVVLAMPLFSLVELVVCITIIRFLEHSAIIRILILGKK